MVEDWTSAGASDEVTACSHTPPRRADLTELGSERRTYAAFRTPWLRPSASLSRADLSPRALSFATRTAMAIR